MGLLHRLLVDKKKPSSLAELGITESSFIEEEARVFTMICDHYADHGALPMMETVEEETEVKLKGFPNEPMSYWADKVKRRNQRRLIIQLSERAQKCAQDDSLDDAKGALQECLFGLDAIAPSDQVRMLSVVAQEVIAAHDKRRSSTVMSGVSFGIEYIDMVTDGAQPGDSIALVARPGIGKTYLLLQSALAAWKLGHVPLFHSMEMASMPIVRRMIALRTKVPAMNIRTGRLSNHARSRLQQDVVSIQKAERKTPFYLLQGDLTSTVEDLILRVRELKPTVLYVDGAYLLRTRTRTAARWERVTETAEVLKRLAVEFKIPAIATYQFNRRGPGSLGNIAFADTVGQLASIVLGLSDEDKENSEGSFSTRMYKILHLIKGREGERGTVRVLYDMERMEIKQDSILHGYDEWEV
jgi:replicative DNA helicase